MRHRETCIAGEGASGTGFDNPLGVLGYFVAGPRIDMLRVARLSGRDSDLSYDRGMPRAMGIGPIRVPRLDVRMNSGCDIRWRFSRFL
jgi:hypothetical protein